MSESSLAELLPEDTTDVSGMREFVDEAIDRIEEGDVQQVVEFMEDLEGEGAAEVPHMSGLGQDDFYHYFGNALLGKYSKNKTPSYDDRDSVSLTSRNGFNDPLFDVFIDRHPEVNQEAAKDSFKAFSNSWSASRPESAPIQEYAVRQTGNQNAFPKQEWWSSRDVSEEVLEAVQKYAEFQQKFIQEAFDPQDGKLLGFRSFKDEEILENNSERDTNGSIRLDSAPIEHWSPSPSDSAHYARDSDGTNHGFIIVDQIDVSQILGAGFASNAFAMNISEMYVLRNEQESYNSDQIVPYEDADILELAVRSADRVGEVPQTLQDHYDL